MLRIFSALFCILQTRAAPAQDAVKSLPGYDGALKSKHYSGYLPVGNLTGVPGMLHYWLIEAENDPANAPVALWLNGGPGSSSLIGLLTENGQVATNVNSMPKTEGEIPSLFYNPFSWSQVANVLYLEQPKGVGFSYCTGGNEGCRNTDESTAADSYEALVHFFDHKFPEYKQSDFYITGESYAGTYIPMIMDVADKNGKLPNLKGAAIGDGCYGNSIGLCGNHHYEQRVDAEIFAGHAMYPTELYRKITAECPTNFSDAPSLRCSALYRQMETSLGDFNVYNIYDQCPSSGAKSSVGGYSLEDVQNARQKAREEDWFHGGGLAASLHPHPALNNHMGGALNDWICGGEEGMGAWLGNPKVQEALHVTGHADSRMQYKSTVDDLRPVYKRLAQKYRMMIYSGDVDACVPYYASESWTAELGFKVVENWRPWTAGSLDAPNDNSIRAGYVISYNTGVSSAANPGGNFTFATVAGAGHMVPTHKPPQALALLKRFLANEPL